MDPDSDYSGPSTSENLDRRNILIFGDVGTGKSALINLITGKEQAVTSSGAKLCTVHWQEYIVTIDGVEFALYDTAGMHESQGNMRKAEYLDAIYEAHALISRLERSAGGISLLVHCIKGGRISITMSHTYNLFVEVLCNRQVPVVIVVTHLDMHESMEDWWTENERGIKEYQLRSDGHACITTTRGYKNAFNDKYEESRDIVHKLLLEHSSLSGQVTWKEEMEKWVKRVLSLTRSPRLERQRQASFLQRALIRRCGFSIEDAEAVSQSIQQSREIKDVPEEDRSWFDDEKLY